MTTRGLLLGLALALVCGTASANVIIHEYGERGEGVIAPEVGDPIFWPTDAQLQGWVNDGINAAATETALLDIPGISAWVGTFPQGIACNAGYLRFTIAVTPQVCATAAGWSAAWEPDLWARMQTDQQAVAAEIAGALSRGNGQGGVPFILGIARDDPRDYLDAAAAVYAYGEWRYVSLNGGATVSMVADDAPCRTRPSSKWAGNYVMAWMMYDSALSAPDYITVVNGSLRRRQQMAPDTRLTDQVQAPYSGWRLVVGRPEECAFVDF